MLKAIATAKQKTKPLEMMVKIGHYGKLSAATANDEKSKIKYRTAWIQFIYYDGGGGVHIILCAHVQRRSTILSSPSSLLPPAPASSYLYLYPSSAIGGRSCIVYIYVLPSVSIHVNAGCAVRSHSHKKHTNIPHWKWLFQIAAH